MAAILGLFYLMIHIYVSLFSLALAEDDNQFVYNGFRGVNLSMEHFANIHSNGLLQLTDNSSNQMGHAFYQQPLKFNSFSTYFVFAMVRGNNEGGHGLAFVMTRSTNFSEAVANAYLGLFNISNFGLSTNHVLAIEFDTVLSPEFDDISDNHVGIDVNSLISKYSANASYISGEGEKNITMISGNPIQVWIDYDAAEMLLKVTLAPIRISKPNSPLLSSHINISDVFLDTMYVGFSAATGTITSNHYILGWSFNTSGKAQTLNYSDLPDLPELTELTEVTELPKVQQSKSITPVAKIVGSLTAFVVLLITITGATYLYRRKYRELREEWEEAYGPQRFSYKHLYKATKGFSNTELLGRGGCGDVFRGTLGTNQQIAVKRVSHNIQNGMKQFVAEIVSMGRLRHKNLVQLLGYCRRKGELLLVYECMHGSLDDFLFSNDKPNLTWSQRFQIIKGVASALLYLHEEWEQVVLHRDIKASNILLDANLNGRLGDFGLARLYDRGSHPETTQLVGTPGYLAPELTRTSKATVSSDVFGFGVFLLEVACGRRPIEHQGLPEEKDLIDWVIGCWGRNALLDVVDPRLECSYALEEAELILKLGLLCTQSVPAFRPGMGQVVQYLDGNVILPDIQPENRIDIFRRAHQPLGFPLSIPSSLDNNCTPPISSTDVITDQAFGPLAASSRAENYSPLVTSITVSISNIGR